MHNNNTVNIDVKSSKKVSLVERHGHLIKDNIEILLLVETIIILHKILF